jgi:hypothetical protein
MTKYQPPISAKSAERIELYRIDQRYKTCRTLLRCLFGVGAVFYLHDIFSVLAGETTKLAFELSVLADVRLVLTLTLTGCAAAWGAIERTLRYRKVEQLQGRIKELELRIDPRRTSSGLTPKGKTNPRDKT